MIVYGLLERPVDRINMQMPSGETYQSPFVDASSITKIECSDVISPAQKSIIVEESQTKSGIKFTLHKVEFSDKNTRVYLTIENNNKNTEISFYDFNSKAIQGNRQFETTTDYEVDYPEIQSDIPAGIVEDGVILFEPLSVDKGNMKLQFETSKNYQDVNFVFNIDSSAQSQQETEEATPDTTTIQLKVNWKQRKRPQIRQLITPRSTGNRGSDHRYDNGSRDK